MPSVAILGASTHRSKFGNKAVRAFVEAGWVVYPVHPREPFIEGLACLSNVRMLPEVPDVFCAYLPPSVLLSELAAMGQLGCGEIWLNPGTDTVEVLNSARRIGLKIVQDCSLLRSGRTPRDFP